MGFKEAIRTVIKEKYATFSGRASRSEFWLFQLFFYLIFFSLGAVIGIFVSASRYEQSIPGYLIAIGVVTGILFVALIIPHVALAVRRLHDRNLSGWWYLGFIIANSVPHVGSLASIALLVVFVSPGTKGPNRFGADPLNPQFTAEVFA